MKIYNPFSYKGRFRKALQFSQLKHYKVSATEPLPTLDQKLAALIIEDTMLMVKAAQAEIGLTQFAPIFGQQCGNAHINLIEYLQKRHPELPINLTTGDVNYGKKERFKFTKKTFEEWLVQKPEILDCHVWITIGTNIILDATLPTWVNTKEIGGKKVFGGIYLGEHGKIVPWNTDIPGEAPGMRAGYPKYYPVAVGIDAFKAVAPLAKRA